MAKKEKLPLTPEQLAAKNERKAQKRKLFGTTFLKALAVMLSILLVYSIVYIAFGQGTTIVQKVVSNGSSSQGGGSSYNGGGSSSNSGSSSSNSGSSSSNNGGSAAPVDNGGSAAPVDNGGSSDSGDASANDAAAIAEKINAATAKAVGAGYDWYRNCTVEDIDVGSATDTLNGIIKRVDENADLNSVVGGFLGRGEKNETIAKGEDATEKTGSANYPIKATSLQADDLQGLQVNGNTYSFTLANASNPQKDNSTPLARLTNDFITHQEVADGVKDAMGALSFLLSVKSSDVTFSDIKVTVTLDDAGNLTELTYSYYMDVTKLELSVATGTGHGNIEGKYSNFVY